MPRSFQLARQTQRNWGGERKLISGLFMEEFNVALKLCEGCGCHWLRTSNQKSVYCIDCRGKLETFPNPETRKRPGRPKKVARIWAVATAEGGGL